MLESHGLSDIGPLRKKNEDAWLMLPEYRIFAIADGIGGHNAGEVASSLAMDLLKHYVKKTLDPKKFNFPSKIVLMNHFSKIISQINKTVLKASRSDQSLYGMGTTLCCLYILKNSAVCAHIGDSRIYRFRNNSIKQLTEDHSQIIKTKDDELKQVITRAVGCQETVLPDISMSSIQENDIFMLCSDGMATLNNNDIINILKDGSSLQDKSCKLITLAKKRGSIDNVTTVLIKINKP